MEQPAQLDLQQDVSILFSPAHLGGRTACRQYLQVRVEAGGPCGLRDQLYGSRNDAAKKHLPERGMRLVEVGCRTAWRKDLGICGAIADSPHLRYQQSGRFSQMN